MSDTPRQNANSAPRLQTRCGICFSHEMHKPSAHLYAFLPKHFWRKILVIWPNHRPALNPCQIKIVHILQATIAKITRLRDECGDVGLRDRVFVAKWSALWVKEVRSLGVNSAECGRASTSMVFRVSPPGMISLGWDSAVRAKGRGSDESEERATKPSGSCPGP